MPSAQRRRSACEYAVASSRRQPLPSFGSIAATRAAPSPPSIHAAGSKCLDAAAAQLCYRRRRWWRQWSGWGDTTAGARLEGLSGASCPVWAIVTGEADSAQAAWSAGCARRGSASRRSRSQTGVQGVAAGLRPCLLFSRGAPVPCVVVSPPATRRYRHLSMPLSCCQAEFWRDWG